MIEPFNFHDTWIIAEHNWWLLLLTLGLGIWIGWRECTYKENQE